ncbi:MAG: dihydropyrimidinase [Gemmatimonadetes bacterium]|nr:dihydropyrimidinase [Gemmatimonadota bacterium]
MPEFDLVVRGGTVVNPDATLPDTDVGVRNGRIVALGRALGPGREEVDARDRLVLPGAIDAHCHLAQVSSTGLLTSDDFLSGSRSAALGGTTTIVPFAAQHRGQSLRAVVAAYREEARRSMLDYAFHMIVSDPSPTVLDDELPSLVAEGHVSFKVFLTYEALRLDDRQVLQVLDVARRAGALTMFHAEHHEAIAYLTQRLLAEGKVAPKWHPYARPEAVEREATARAIMLAEVAGARIMIVHVSGREALDEVRRAKARGVAVQAETCPQYLSFTRADLDRPGFEGAKLMFSPPARDAESQEALWGGLRDGTIDIFSSDHAPYRYDDVKGKKAHGVDAPFTKIPNGVPAIGVRPAVLFSEGVQQGRLSIERFVQLVASEPARVYGLDARKGRLAPGMDADIAIWDPAREVTVRHAMLGDNMDYSPWEGHRFTGWPVATIARGEVITRDGEVLGAEGRGQFLDRRPWVR